MLKTTIAFTTQSGSDAYNVIPQEATLGANMRFIPHQGEQESLTIIQKLAEKHGLSTEVLHSNDFTPPVDIHGEAFTLFTRVIGETFPGLAASPYVMTGATDAQFYQPICKSCIRFAPVIYGPEQMKGMHGLNENIEYNCLPGAVLYFRIYALGMPALGIFNFGNAVLSASGDTKRPLAYLTAAGILNVILNLFFVIVCKMAADGVALASIISQYLSAVLVLLHMTRLTDSCRVEWKLLRLHGSEVGRILGLGVPAGIQHMIFAVANLFIQVGINSFDSTVVSGNSAAVNVDNVIYNVMAAFYTACSTFMGQNWGAGKKERMMKSYYISLGYSFAIAAVLGAAFLLCGEPFLYIFTNDADVVAAGMERMRIMCFSYCVSAFMDCTIAACRGLGRSFVPTVIVIMGSCVFRVIWVYTIFAHFHTIPSLYLLYIFSWTITAAAEILYFIRCCRRLRTAQTA